MNTHLYDCTCRYGFTTKVNRIQFSDLRVCVILSDFFFPFPSKTKKFVENTKRTWEKSLTKVASKQHVTKSSVLPLVNQKLTFVPFQFPNPQQALFDTSWCSVLTFVRDFSHVPYSFSYLFCAVILPQVSHRLCRVQYYGCLHKKNLFCYL